MEFKSKYKEHRLVMSPERHRVVDGNTQIEQGKAIEFKDFIYETEDKEEIKFIKGHRTFDVKIFAVKSEEEQEDELLKKANEVKAKREGKKAKKGNKKTVADEVEAKAKKAK